MRNPNRSTWKSAPQGIKYGNGNLVSETGNERE